MFPELDKNFDNQELEDNCKTLWDKTRVYQYNANVSREKTFSVDTPPPYVSASHLHVGHAMSYTQAEILVRYKRMQGYNIYYPMGFDDNGLPTERYVEQTHKVNKKKISRSDFRKLCIQETQKGAKTYEELWRSLGLSVDWSLRYSTIDDLSRHTAQKSFLDLYSKGLIERAEEPVIWDTHFETALAQADLETIERKGKLYDIAFEGSDGQPMIISTTRPELIPACVALFYNPGDNRYTKYKDQKAKVPLFGQEVPILESEEVDIEFGTGLMMVCTFGDGEDVKKWKEHKLDTRICIHPNGTMTELAGDFAGMTIPEARKKIIDALNDKELVLDQKTVQQNVSVGERSETPVEFVMVPQWFINVLDHRDAFLKRSEELEWFPDWMKVRLDHWIEGLKYNWNISRQRFYGVPFPVWYVEETGEIAVAKEEDLPIDPMEDSPPPWMLEHYKGKTLVPESDVMDTWMTSSLTPLINANWAERDNIKGAMQNIYPMDLRIQAFEIIRTWLFYTVIKSHFHTDSLPWKTVMISGWGLNEQGKKISKRHLESFTDQNGFNRYEPYSLIEKYGADAVRYWAANGQLGQNLRFHEREVKDGRKIVVKLWNVARMVFMYLDDFDPAKDYVSYDERTLEDRWISFELDKVVSKTTDYLDKYDYSGAKETIHKFFWMTYCDTYLELVKTRFWDEYSWTEQDKRSAQSALLDSLNILLKILAPFLPFITEEIYQKANKFGEDCASLHVAEWPKAQNLAFEDDGRMKILLDILYKARKSRSEKSISQSNQLDKVTICIKESNVDISKDGYMYNAVLSAVRAKKVEWQTLSKDMEENNILVQLA